MLNVMIYYIYNLHRKQEISRKSIKSRWSPCSDCVRLNRPPLPPWAESARSDQRPGDIGAPTCRDRPTVVRSWSGTTGRMWVIAICQVGFTYQNGDFIVI